MSAINIDELPLATEGGQGRAPSGPITIQRDGGRRQFMGTAVKAATFVGLTGLGLFRSAKRAGAENPPWNEFTQGCGIYGVDPDTCDDNMCVGTSLDLMDNLYCTTDCADVDANNTFQWHKNRTEGSYTWRDYPGDICAAYSGQAARDAWRWDVGPCGTCNPAVYRCHDGEKRTGTGEWQFTICEGLATCNGSPVTCP
jgi:hypothetical protein